MDSGVYTSGNSRTGDKTVALRTPNSPACIFINTPLSAGWRSGGDKRPM